MIALFAMPDDPAAIPAWLDRQLLGPELPHLVAELRAAHRPGPPPTLAAVLGEHRAAFLAGGFTALPRQVLRQLLRNPDLLLELPELVFVEGGGLWFADPPDAATTARASKVADRVHAALLAEPRRPARSVRWLSYAGVSVATAAAVLIAVYLGGGFRSNPPPPSGWGFAKLKELPRNADRAAVLNRLADLAGEWEKKPPDDAAGLARRLHEFREGCTALQLADDLPLAKDDRDWLAGRCLAWSGQLDSHLLDLERTRDVPAVSAAATATARGMADELRQRAG